MSDVLSIENDGHVRVIRLNRPEKKNALSSELAWGVLTAIEEAHRDDDVWVIGVTGVDDAFCAGLDLAGSEAVSPLSPQTDFLDDIHWVGRFLLTLRYECDKPIVAGVNGVAVGAGLSLAMGADIRLMKRGARILAGYPRIGGSPDGGLTWTLVQAIGYEQAMRFLLENRTVEADEAKALGLVSEVVEAEQWEDRFRDYLRSLTNLSPITARLTKRTLGKAMLTTDLESHVRYELSSIRTAFSSEDAKEARQAFFEKRQPTFQGR
jgi:2-(1,2-epoxy-1,2-dihydrophenyl)acetyl-CoA isomerase